MIQQTNIINKQQSLGWLFFGHAVVFILKYSPWIGDAPKPKGNSISNTALHTGGPSSNVRQRFSGNPGLNFVESGVPADYLEFRNNDSAYAYFTLYLPFSKDTASYVVSNNTIITTDTRQYGIIFQHQDNTGAVQQTTQINILEIDR